jgi:sigma-B regulation protein RsbU (phosphoserine phosphatase)
MSKEQKLIELHADINGSGSKVISEQVAKILKKFNIESQRIMETQLVLSAWIKNLQEHPKTKVSKLHLIFSVFDNDFFMLKIRDNSTPFNDFEYYLHQLEHDSKEIGHGMFVMREYFTHATYSSRHPGVYEYNQLCLPVSQSSSMQTNKPRVLILSDDKVLSMYLSFLLKKDFLIDSLSSGSELVEQIKNKKYEAVLIDSVLPDCDSGDLRDSIIHNKKFKHIPFIFMANTENEMNDLRTTLLSIDEYLIKPIKKNKLLKLLNRVVSRKRNVAGQFELPNYHSKLLKAKLPTRMHNFSIAQWSFQKEGTCTNFLIHVHKQENDYLVLGDLIKHMQDDNYQAAIYSGYVRAALSALLTILPFEEVLDKISSMMFNDDSFDAVISTVVLIELNHKEGLINIINAGHISPMIISPNLLRQASVNGDLLGLTDDSHYNIERIKLEKDESLVLFSNGLLDLGEGAFQKEYHLNNVKRILQKNAHLSLDEQSLQLKKKFEEMINYQDWSDTTVVFIGKDH